MILVRPQDEISHLNSILMLGDCIDKTVTSLGCKVTLWCVLKENCKESLHLKKTLDLNSFGNMLRIVTEKTESGRGVRSN